MPDIFADTAGWGHLVDSSQEYHTRAATIYRRTRQQGRKLITTNYILTELVALLISPLRIPHPNIVAFITGGEIIASCGHCACGPDARCPGVAVI